MKIRTTMIKGYVYLQAEDVAKYIRELAMGETGYVRNRLEEAAHTIRTFHLISDAWDKKPEPKSCWDGFSFDADGQMADEEWEL